MAICPNCGGKNAAKAKFCAQCGYALGATPPGGALPVPAGALGPPVQGATLQVSSTLRGRYRIAAQLGKGGMGAVYLAQDANAFNRRCVVKEMLPYYTTAAEKAKAEKDFEREARVLATLRTDGVPQVFEYFIEQGNYYLVMEYIEGDNLEALAAKRGGRLPLDEALTYGLQLANILISLGKQTPPVIHRDIKPANVILDAEQNRVKLVDFGLAKESAGGMTGTLSAPLGTPGYAPLEQYSNQVEPRTDIYALGATLHHLITGRDPRIEGGFDFPPLAQFLPGVRPEIADLLARMTAQKVADRPSAAEVRDAFAAVVQPQGGRAAAQVQPFPFRSGPMAFDASDLALLCDQHWQDGIYHLYSGHFEPWLDALNRHDLAVRAESIRVRGGDQSAGLEEFLRAANPTIPLPSLAVSARTLDLGAVEKGAPARALLAVKNAGRGCLYGRVAVQAGWVAVKPDIFSLLPNEEAQVEVSVATAALAEGPFAAPAFEVTSNGGREAVAVQAAVTWQPALVVEPRRRLELGEMLHTALTPRTVAITVRNAGGGLLQGRLAADAPWLAFDPPDFCLPAGGSATVHATATLADPTPQSYSTAVRVESNAGVQELAAAVGVRRDWYDRRTRARTWAIYGGLLAFAALALAVGALLVLVLLSGLLSGDRMSGWGWGVLGAAALVAGAGGAVWWSGRWTAQLDEIENYYHGSDLVGALLTPRFVRGRPIVLGATGLLYGGMVVLRELNTGGYDLGGMLLVPLFGALAGVAFGLAPGPAQVRTLFTAAGRTVDSRQALVWARTAALMLAGGLFGHALGEGLTLLLPAILWGALAGLLLASDMFTSLALRLSWLLDAARVGLLVGLGAFLAVDAAMNLWSAFGGQWRVVENYGALGLTFGGVGALLRLLLFAAAGMLGGLGGLWAAGWAGKPPVQARRLLLGMAVLLGALSLPVTLLSGLVLHWFLPRNVAGPLVFALTAVAIGAGAWALPARRSQVETGLAHGRGLLTAGLSRSRAHAASAAGHLQQQIVSAGTAQPGRLRALGARARAAARRAHLPVGWGAWLRSLSLPSLAEVETGTTWPLTAGAAVLALLVQGIVAHLAVQIVVGLGILALALALAVALALGARYACRYLRK